MSRDSGVPGAGHGLRGGLGRLCLAWERLRFLRARAAMAGCRRAWMGLSGAPKHVYPPDMKTLFRIALLCAALGTTSLGACASSGSSPSSEQAIGPEAVLVGQWNDNDNVLYTFEKQGGAVVLVSIQDTDGEMFEVQASGMEGGAYQFRYFVPSTQYVVTIRILGFKGEPLPAEWENSAGDSGQESFRRAL